MPSQIYKPRFSKPTRIKSRPTKTFPNGRVILSVKDWKAMRIRVYFEQGAVCAICHKYMRFNEFDLDHIKKRGLNGCKRDDRRENLRATHSDCNRLRDSQPMWSKGAIA